MFTLTSKLNDAVMLVNSIPPTKLPLLLNRIINSIQVEVCSFQMGLFACVHLFSRLLPR